MSYLNYELDKPLLKGKNKILIGLMKDELGGKSMTKFFGLKGKTYSYLIDDCSIDKKAKGTKKGVIERKFKVENYKNCLEGTQRDNKINYLEKNKIDIDNVKKSRKEFVKNNMLIVKTQQRFKNERHHVFTEETNKIVLSSNDAKRMQSIASIEKYAYGTSKDVVS